MIKHLLSTLAIITIMMSACKPVTAPEPFGAVPSEQQLAWHELEYYAFIHFSMNTFTDQEWGDGGTPVSAFNPDKLDVHQWVNTCKDAGMKGIMITAKHHCGFCLWPSAYTEYSVKNSPWKDGKGDIIKELSEACREAGLRFGVYLSPWDRNHAQYGFPEYITYFRNQLTELLSNYGDIYEMWFDGANGGDGYYGGAWEKRKIDATTYYDWENTWALARQLQPNIVMFSDGGPEIRWCGNERGYIGETNWSKINKGEFHPGVAKKEILEHGLPDGNAWIPGEVDVSIRPGWFYHAKEDSLVKSVDKLMEIYYTSVGRNGNLILNVPVDTHGLIHEIDVQRLKDFAEARRKAFAKNLAAEATYEATPVRGSGYEAEKAFDGDKLTYWATPDDVTSGSLTVTLKETVKVNKVLLQEHIRLGQRVRSFTVEALVDGTWKQVAEGTTIGYKRILCFPETMTRQLRITITDSAACPLIQNIEIY
ncbi:MAG: alpha-L-fucosidase [Bacteroidales bacterium]|nr:alpha-L-fucosidase [Bacteroidales bacterium]